MASTPFHPSDNTVESVESPIYDDDVVAVVAGDGGDGDGDGGGGGNGDGDGDDDGYLMMDPWLLMALKTGDFGGLDELLGTATSGDTASLLEGVTCQGDFALHVVAASGDGPKYLNCAEKIYDMANHLVEEKNNNGDTPLHCAARAGNRNMVVKLINMVKAADAPVAAADAPAAAPPPAATVAPAPDRSSCCFCYCCSPAASATDISSTVQQLLRKENNMRETVLHSAIRSRDLELIQQLLREDPDLADFPQDQDATSPLYLAISTNLCLHCVRQLFEHRSFSASGPHGQNVLHRAVLRDFSHGKAVQDVLKWIPRDNPPHLTLKELTEQADMYGNTPLHLVAINDMWDKTLLTVFLYTVGLHIAYPFCILPYMPMDGPTRVLIEANEASVFQPNNEGSYPIHLAARYGSIKAAVLMIERFPSCATLCDSFGRTFLHVAVEKNMWVIVGYACHHPKLGSVFNMQDNSGNTALHLAVLGGNQWTFRYLFQNPQVRLDLLNNNGQTVIELARLENPAVERFYHILNPRSFIYRVLRIARAPYASAIIMSRTPTEEEDRLYSENMTKGSQVLGILAALITSATFAAAFNLPGGRRPAASSGAVGSSHDGETPWLAGTYAFDAFVVSIALAFICALLATIGLIYSGLDIIDYTVRKLYFNRSYALMHSSAKSLAVAFGLGIYLVMHPASPKIATASCVIVFGGLVFQNFEIWQSVILLNTIGIRLGFWEALRLSILGQWEPVVPLPLLVVLRNFWALLVIFLLPTPWISFFNHHASILVVILVLALLLYLAFLKVIFWRCWNWLIC